VRTFGVRGYPAGAQRGDRALVATAEYRFPLLLVERGVWTWPFFLDRVWGDVFLDAGAGWCARNCERRFVASPRRFTPLGSAGAELVVGTVLGYDLGVMLRGGVAVPLQALPATGVRPGPQFYLVGGRSF
jgi:outer membrane protein assembly factor BamA